VVKVLHTADLHLKEYADERWDALLHLLEVARKESVDLLAVSGDLFDRDADAEKLRHMLRPLFSGTGFKVAIVPGNHDSGSYSRGMFFGEDAAVISDPDVPLRCGEVLVWGLPFEPLDRVGVIQRLHSLAAKLPPDSCNMLLYHGELLDAFFSRADLGEEGIHRYMPVKLSSFRELNLHYVLAGHFHSGFRVWRIENGAFFVYPGSPVSITRRETGPRKANLFQAGQPPREYTLHTPHYEELLVELDPFSGEDPLELVRSRLRELHPQARAVLTVSGFINGAALGMSEEELARSLKDLAGVGELAPAVTSADTAATAADTAEGASDTAAADAAPEGVDVVAVYSQFRDIHAVLEDRLCVNFMDKLAETAYDEGMKRRISEMAVRAMMGAGICT